MRRRRTTWDLGPTSALRNPTIMKRRNVLLGLGALTTSSAAAIGTGAFTSVEAKRDITVEVVGDADAFLSLEAMDGPNADAFVTETDGLLGVNIGETDAGGEGVNAQAGALFDDLFTVTNQGSQGVFVYMDTDLPGVNFYRIENGDRRQIDAGTTGNKIPDDIGPRPEIQFLNLGEHIRVGLGIDTVGTPFDRDGSVTIIAETDEDELPSGGGWDREDRN